MRLREEEEISLFDQTRLFERLKQQAGGRDFYFDTRSCRSSSVLQQLLCSGVKECECRNRSVAACQAIQH